MKLLVIVVRGLQASALGSYGNRWVETFCLNVLGHNGVVFDRHLAAHPDPDAARRVWRTGRHAFSGKPSSSADLLAALTPIGVVSRLIVDHSRGELADFEAGWDRVDRAADTSAAVALARAALAEGGPSWLLWLDLAALLPPWRVPAPIVEAYFSARSEEDDEEDDEEDEEVDEEEVAEYVPREPALEPLFDPPLGAIDASDDELYLRLRETYAAAVSHVDGLLGDLLDGLPDDIHVLLTADAGLPLGEHGVVGADRPSLHAETVHVPLIAYGPGCRGGRRVDELTSSLDLAPTIAELAGVRLEGAQGVSLVPCLGGGSLAGREYLTLGHQAGEAVEWGLRTREWAMILTVSDVTITPRLYGKPDDDWEVNDVSKHYPDKVENMERTLRAYVGEAAKPGPVAAPPLEA